jgi:hypothetical protein
MSPGPVISPTPPANVLRANRGIATHKERSIDTVLLRYLRDMQKTGFVKLVALHYSIVLLFIAGVWALTMRSPQPHPEIILKLVGSYCFLIGAIAVPMVAPILFPDIGEFDEGYLSAPVDSVKVFDARFLSVLILSFAILLPLLPLFFIFAPSPVPMLSSEYRLPLAELVKEKITIIVLDLIPFIQALITTSWVYLLMEMAGGSEDHSSRLGRRLAIVGSFVFLHVILVGLLAQLSFSTLQNLNPLKLVIDLNPFSQLFILMEGRIQNRLLLNTDFQHFVDYRVYLFILTSLILGIALVVYRMFLKEIKK